jgi:hypothetical protein
LTTAKFDRNQLSPDSIGFSPLNPCYENACPQHLFRPPRSITPASPYPGLVRLVSGRTHVTKGTYHTSPLASCGILVSLWLLHGNGLTLPHRYTPWPVIRNGWHNTLAPCLTIAAKFQGLLTPYQGYFSTFHHCTVYAIGLRMCLGLEVNSSQIRTSYQGGPTLDTSRSFPAIPTGLSPSSAPLSRGL